MQIQLNHKSLDCPPATTVEVLLTRQGIVTKHIAIALNNAVLKREAWATTQLQEGDSLLVIGAIKGG